MSGPIRRRDLALQRIAQFVAHIRQHGFNDARIPRHDITGHHVVMTAGEIADDTARFTNQQFARGEIPRTKANFKETIDTTCSHIGQIQRGGTGAAEIGAFGEQLADNINVGGRVLFGFEREAGGENSAVQIARGTAAQTVAVQLRA